MTPTENIKADFQLKRIFLKKSIFSFDSIEEGAGVKAKGGIHVKYNKIGEEIHVSVTLKINQEENNLNIETEMVGIFLSVKESELSLDQFARQNAAAIIYPYIRQHLWSLSVQAGMKPIVSPLLNFTKLQ